jgi:mitochondrial import inner membrane translocase subunit TIM22
MDQKKESVQDSKSLAFSRLTTENMKKRNSTEFQAFLTDRYRNFDIFPKMTAEEKIMYRRMQIITNFFQEGCLVRAAVMGAGGGMLGMLCGSFMFGMKHVEMNPDMNWKQSVQHTYCNFFRHATKTGKEFMKLGFLYSFIECLVIKVN